VEWEPATSAAKAGEEFLFTPGDSGSGERKNTPMTAMARAGKTRRMGDLFMEELRISGWGEMGINATPSVLPQKTGTGD
jgi:hypothetical protein